jgi:hypothetical protein
MVARDQFSGLTPEYWYFWIGLAMVSMSLFGRVYGLIVFAFCMWAMLVWMHSLVESIPLFLMTAFLIIGRRRILSEVQTIRDKVAHAWRRWAADARNP